MSIDRIVKKLRSRDRIKPIIFNDAVVDFYGKDPVITQIKVRKSGLIDTSLNISKINDNYQVLLNDNSIINPFVISRELGRIINNQN